LKDAMQPSWRTTKRFSASPWKASCRP
jgi:hypothetical protein